jgi:hypothetical protein
MSEANFATEVTLAPDAAPRNDDAADEGLPGVRRLWDETFGALLKLCRDVAATDDTRLAPSAGRAADMGRQEVAA